ncbi:MAG: DegQ family serine endoprotease [Gammaproteobacteria bacterium]|nr:DegQ family serine endoprotease [Gammaproteobacteria bacterium]
MNSKTQRMPVVILALLLIFWIQGAIAALPLMVDENGRPTLAPMLKKVTPAVVNISTKSHVRIQQNPLFNDPFFRRFFDAPKNMPQQKERQALGSGVILDAKNGFILTNNHVIANADEIMVTLKDHRQFEATLVGADPAADLAVIHINAKNLSQLSVADSETLEVGDFVVAIGNPFGLEQTVTSGIVSALGRSGLGIEGYENFVQTDASINPGNSGGALVDLDGKLIGINTAIVGPSGGNVGIGFAIPSNMAQNIMSQLIEFGEVRRGQLGLMIQDVTPNLAEALNIKQATGAIVSQILKDSAADEAGLKVGDVVVAINGKDVRSAYQLRNSFGLLRVGEKVALDVLRDGKQGTIHAKIAAPEHSVEKSDGRSRNVTGAVLGPIDKNHPLAGKVDGVNVVRVDRGSAAAKAGLRKNDIIVSVNRQPVSNMADVRRAAKDSKRGILLAIRRGEGGLLLVIR